MKEVKFYKLKKDKVLNSINVQKCSFDDEKAMGGLSNLQLFISYNFRKIGLLSFDKTKITLKKIKHRFNFEKINNIV